MLAEASVVAVGLAVALLVVGQVGPWAAALVGEEEAVQAAVMVLETVVVAAEAEVKAWAALAVH